MPKLPLKMLTKRLRTELKICNRDPDHRIELADPTLTKFPVEVRVTVNNCQAFVLKNDKLATCATHVFVLLITDQYPYERPKIRWQTPIFHPNIKMPEDGGQVCSKLVDNWNCRSNLAAFIKGIETLLTNPNPQNPLDTNSCTLSAEYFNKNQYTSPAILINGSNGLKVVNKE